MVVMLGPTINSGSAHGFSGGKIMFFSGDMMSHEGEDSKNKLSAADFLGDLE